MFVKLDKNHKALEIFLKYRFWNKCMDEFMYSAFLTNPLAALNFHFNPKQFHFYKVAR